MSQLLDLLDLIVRFFEWLSSRSEKRQPPHPKPADPPPAESDPNPPSPQG